MRRIFSLLIALLTVSVTVVYAEVTRGDYTYHNDGTIEYLKKSVIFLKNDSTNTDTESKLSLKNLNAEPPAECYQKTVACTESTEITVITKKTWVPVKLASILSESLTTENFAKFFPDLPANKKITNGSKQQDKLIAQRILYEIGLLKSLPTGKFGYLTELATIKLQCLSGINEYDSKLKIAVLGTKTVNELNAIKAKLSDPNYLKKNPFANFDPSSCPANLTTRINTIESLLNSPTSKTSSSTQSNPQKAAESITPVQPNSLQFDGEVTIKKQ